MTLASELLAKAQAAKIKIATAESCTGGLLSGAITDIPGSSDIFDRGWVTYSNDAKIGMLGVSSRTLDTHGAVSEEVAAEMAEGTLPRSGAELAVAVTGIAGPGSSDHKPEGRVCFAVARSGRTTRSETVEFGAVGRSGVRKASVDHALRLLIAALDGSASGHT